MQSSHPGTDSRSRTLVVAGLSVRALAESARQGGWQVIALDLFGDLDTRRASTHWEAIGDPGTLHIDPARLRDGLQRAARCPGVDGWIAGSGLAESPALLDAGGTFLPRLGTPTACVARLRDPLAFFATLDRHGLPHPAISLALPSAPSGWLAKRAGGCGGVHIRGAARMGQREQAGAGDTYYQRIQPGTSMSALFVADGRTFRLVALNRLLVQAMDDRPCVYVGAIGPVDAPVLERAAAQALAALVPDLAVCGLASLDFIADAHSGIHLLEINPRPSASMQLHAAAWPEGLVRAHVQAVLGRLPATPACKAGGVRGHATVFAGQAGRIDAELAATLMQEGHHHDLPSCDAFFERGSPLCTVSAEAATVDETDRLLGRRAAQVPLRLAVRAAVALETEEGTS